MAKKKILVVLGGNSKEREISIKTGKACVGAIKRLGYKVEIFDPKKKSFFDIIKSKSDILGIVHSHPQDILEFSEGDKYSCKAIDLTFYLVSPKSDKIKVMHPSELNA